MPEVQEILDTVFELDSQEVLDLDALLAEAGLVEPDPISLKWRGQIWSITPISALNPKVLTELGSLDGVLGVIGEALGEEQYVRFPAPRQLQLPNGKTELEMFLDAWTSVSNESASAGE